MTIYIVEIVRCLADGAERSYKRAFNNEQKAIEKYSRYYIGLDFGIIRLFEVVDDQKALIKEDVAELF